MSMNLDYEDFADGGGSMSIRRASTRLPFWVYKRTEEFEQKQLAKPQADSRNPNGTEHRYWELEDKDENLTGNHVHEVSGRRIYRGNCDRCHDVVLVMRDVSGPEFRGRGNRGWRGRYPKYCTGCQDQRAQERREEARQGMARLRRDPSSRRRDFECRGRA